MSSTPGQPGPEQPAMILRPTALPVTHVVIGVDGSPGSEAALRWAAAEAVRRQTGLRIVSAWQEPAQSDHPQAGHPAQAAAHILQIALADILSQHQCPRRIACAAPCGNPGETLLAQTRGSGLLVLGAIRADPIQVPGAISRYCLQHGSCPLVVVPAAAPGGNRSLAWKPDEVQSGPPPRPWRNRSRNELTELPGGGYTSLFRRIDAPSGRSRPLGGQPTA
ncbi:MAG: universal stress protein [Trebonia sp.]